MRLLALALFCIGTLVRPTPLDAEPIHVLMWDERLSTVAAERGLLEADVSRAKRATRIDSAAAAFILQGALDRLAYLFSAGSD